MAGKRASGKVNSQGVFGHPSKRAKTPFRAGLYARVSTSDQQTIPLQIRALREYAARRGWTVAMQVKEIGSVSGGGRGDHFGGPLFAFPFPPV